MDYADTENGNFYWESYCAGGSTVELDTDVTVTTDAYDLVFFGEYYLSIDYYTYQFNSSCYYDCYHFWDAFGMSPVGGTYTEPATWGLSEPGYSVEHEEIFVRIQFAKSNCPTPTSEISIYTGKKSPSITPYLDMYAAKFKGRLYPLSTRFRGREVLEALSNFSDGCHWTESFLPVKTMGDFSAGGVWMVGVDNYYETDYAAIGTGWADYYQDAISNHTAPYWSSPGKCTAWSVTQAMKIKACSGTSTPTYETHAMITEVTVSTLTSTRDSVSGATN